ncbi:dynactin subunit 2 [Eupeodes corollae]|uniref:dynactin subunit 2 n=1 Tax=Eupeodes corollae TaxID=290404 RepID=UPI00248F5E47|nr:dynactin subunit 2 [Eupeodes corollae]XP_055906486.1 dynactin subunit 2 [Eupeodes corollae]
MADPKFENLPGIAYDQPDVYETPDVEAETSDYYEEEPSTEFIQYIHILKQDSFGKFKGKQFESREDFSDRIDKKYRKGYETMCTDYDREKETPVEKCRRLQSEMNDLLEELDSMRNEKKVDQEERESYDAVATIISTAKKVIDSLRLEQVLGQEHAGAGSPEVDKLIKQVEEYKTSGVLTAYKLPNVDLAASARVAKLEHRLHELEKAVGVNPEKLSRLAVSTGTSNLIEAVRQLSTKAALLQPNQLSQIETRLVNLAGKMDAVAEKSSGSADDAKRDQKVCELYDIAKRTEGIAEILPDIIERMQALESLHKYAMNFAKIIAEVEETQSSICRSLANNKTLLTSVQETFANNLENVNKEVNKLETRINAIQIPK